MFKLALKTTSMKMSRRQMLKKSMTITAGCATAPILADHLSDGLESMPIDDTDNIVRKKPNVLFIAMDDLCDWVSPMGYKQAKTPNFDRLAKTGTTFMNAHCPGVFSTPSRTAILTGLFASRTGCYQEDVFIYDHPDIVTLQMTFQKGGYSTYGAGKIYHHMQGFIDLRGWDEYFTRNQEEKDSGWQMNAYNLKGKVPRPDPSRLSSSRLINSSLRQWGPIDNNLEEEMVDTVRTKWACDVLRRKHNKPFFLALGLYSPHVPLYAPQKYFDMYDRDSLQLPPQKPDDLEDLPSRMREQMERGRATNTELEKLGAVKDAIHAYLASVSFADANLGRVLDALDTSPEKENTIIVVWGDNGFHHGEKFRWDKHTLWERTSNVPFIWAGKGIAKGAKVESTVSLIDIYPTFIELCKLPLVNQLDGVSLVPTLQKPSKAIDRNVLLPHLERGSFAIINMNWKYIRYYDGGEELYNLHEDPNEWFNLAKEGKYQSIITELRKAAPPVFAPSVTPRSNLKLVIEGDSFHWEKRL
jgi:arylsulfatase A-like enzyme